MMQRTLPPSDCTGKRIAMDARHAVVDYGRACGRGSRTEGAAREQDERGSTLAGAHLPLLLAQDVAAAKTFAL